MRCICYATPQDHDLMRGFMKDCAPTLNTAAGHSGNNRPFFLSAHNEICYRTRECDQDFNVSSRDAQKRVRKQDIEHKLVIYGTHNNIRESRKSKGFIW